MGLSAVAFASQLILIEVAVVSITFTTGAPGGSK